MIQAVFNPIALELREFICAIDFPVDIKAYFVVYASKKLSWTEP